MSSALQAAAVDDSAALHAAALAADDAEVNRIIAASATTDIVHAKDPIRQETPLHAACRSDLDAKGGCIQALLSKNSNPAAVCVHGGNCLHQACQFGNEGAVRLMLDSGRGPEGAKWVSKLVACQDKNGWTPLHAAVYKDTGIADDARARIVEMLLRVGTGLETVLNKDGLTAMGVARKFACQSGIRSLERVGVRE